MRFFNHLSVKHDFFQDYFLYFNNSLTSRNVGWGDDSTWTRVVTRIKFNFAFSTPYLKETSGGWINRVRVPCILTISSTVLPMKPKSENIPLNQADHPATPREHPYH